MSPTRKRPAAVAEPLPRLPVANPTSAEVARLAGVSRTTVSFVLNGVNNQGISPATRERVLAVAREIGYEPNAAARSLVGGATNTIALVVPQAAHLYVDAFLAQLVASVNETCHEHGLRLLIESTEGAGREPGSFVQLVRSRRIDGLIVANLRQAEQEHLHRLRDQGIPLVAFGQHLRDPAPHQTMGDEPVLPARLAVDHLLDLGHRDIGFVSYARAEYHSVTEREQGWREALQARGLPAGPERVVYADVSAHSGYLATQQLLARGQRFTALFAGNDTIAFGVLRALHEAGLRVPQDVAVVGFDDIPLAAFAAPPLTTVRTDPVGHGRQAVQMLLAQLRPQAAVPVQLAEPPRLVLRESCGASLAPQRAAAAAPSPAAALSAPRRRRTAG